MIIETEFLYTPGEKVGTSSGEIIYTKEEYDEAYNKYRERMGIYSDSIFYEKTCDTWSMTYPVKADIGKIVSMDYKNITVQLYDEVVSEYCRKVHYMIKEGVQYVATRLLMANFEDLPESNIRRAKYPIILIGFELCPAIRKIERWKVFE